MTQEEKELLIKDLCGRLPYGVKIRIEYPFVKEKDWHPEDLYGLDLRREVIADTSIRIEEFKPYLRPMESMTLTEECEFCRLFECDSVNVMFGYIHWTVGGCCDYDDFDIEFSKLAKVIDWLNEHCFDYRNLIEKGLALPAPENMYH